VDKTAAVLFESRAEFREWLTDNALSDDGIWLKLSKDRKVKCITAAEALEEALCFGWIDGQIQSIDGVYYAKYFKQRSSSSRFSAKNKSLVDKLAAKGLMTELGRAKLQHAEQNGLVEVKEERPRLTDEQIQQFEQMLQLYEAAYGNFQKMTKSARASYMSSYFYGAKTEAGKKKRFNTIVERLNLNLNPMESMTKSGLLS